MNNSIGTIKMLSAISVVVLMVMAGGVILAPDLALAKRSADDRGRSEFSGIVQAMPQSGLAGEWVIGGRSFLADERTQFDQADGPLAVGGCAKVHLRGGRVHEIDSEPMQDCL